MLHRLVKFLPTHSFFLFGARGTGKTYLLNHRLKSERTLHINLLDPEEERRLALNPSSLLQRVQSLDAKIDCVFIDEVQKVPALLDVVHHCIEQQGLRFALTGSSARKLKRGGANLLAGRAFTHHLYPLCAAELGSHFELDDVLRWGSLPRLLQLPSEEEKAAYLRSYTITYLKEEIAMEQIVRKLDPFQRFLPIAAQMSGEVINFSKIARDVGVSVKTVQGYFTILEDTLLGRFIQPFHESVRKRQTGNPKFYLFDTGVRRALQRQLTLPLERRSYDYGQAFEHFVINEINRLQHYLNRDYELSFLRTHDNAEIDLIIERPGQARALIEIKSATHITRDDLRHLLRFGADIAESECFCLSQDPHPKVIDGVHCLPWQQGLEALRLQPL